MAVTCSSGKATHHRVGLTALLGVGTSKALDERGMTQLLAKKLMQHRAKSGVACIEAVYVHIIRGPVGLRYTPARVRWRCLGSRPLLVACVCPNALVV